MLSSSTASPTRRRLLLPPMHRRGWRIVVRRVPLYKELYEASSRLRDAKLRTLEFEVRLAEKGRLGLEQLAEVLPRFMPTPKKEEVPEPFVPLTDEDEDSVDHALGGRNRRERLVVHESSNIVITREILQCLNEKDWLNDEVINLYLELLKERELREPNKFLKCHFFNTFFYKKLSTDGYDYKSVRRWTTKRKLGYSLTECDKIFVPIHKEVHWCLAVINIRDKKFQFLDSLGSMDMKALRILARYLVDEVKDKSGQHIDVLSWKQEGVKNLPLQENGWDCGMFMLKYIDFYSRDMDLIFGQAIESHRAGAEVFHGDGACRKKSVEMLEELGLPKGLLPLEDIEEFGYNRGTGFMWLSQRKKWTEHTFKKIKQTVSYAAEVTAFVEKGKLRKITGVKTKELMLWLSVVEVYVANASPEKVTFKTGTGLSDSFDATAFALGE
ncbi:hypothetical protein E2562_007308 [Oryza meyeriana var. granulata]|uniref:Ubiquitin-like protease family profile domain-containing protein n=1 Tax=Oryza meyeriana var. granulata TaxID=110450 RepID=A0A6G1CY00_9ORYZ|nr:hypothetical protein E2562_007308 [Oryza meyeriana var. granulata]